MPHDDLTIRAHVDISTAHITNQDSVLLEECRWPVIVDQLECGFWIWVPPIEAMEDFARVGFSPAFLDLIEDARQAGASHINLDRDAPISDQRPTFEW